MNKKNIFKKTKNLIFFLFVVGAVFLYFKQKNSVTVLVRKIDVENREVRKTVTASGLVLSDKQADLSFIANGNISRILVSENEKVTKGQLLAYINSYPQSQTAQSYKDARDIRLRQKELFENEKKSNSRLLGGNDSYDIKLREYEEALSQAEASYQAQLALLSNYYIYAPYDGTVVNISKKEGEVGTAGVPVITIADLEDIIFEVVLDQEDYSNVKEGQEAEVTLDSYDNHPFKGRVDNLSLYSDPVRGGFVEKIRFESNGKSIKVGMTGDAFMITDKTDGVVPSLIFNEISYDESDRPFVWILENNKVMKEYIEIGLEGDLYVEIKSDLSGKTVVIPAKDNLEIEDGFTAKIIN